VGRKRGRLYSKSGGRQEGERHDEREEDDHLAGPVAAFLNGANDRDQRALQRSTWAVAVDSRLSARGRPGTGANVSCTAA
jgi:hypothetical protein